VRAQQERGTNSGAAGGDGGGGGVRAQAVDRGTAHVAYVFSLLSKPLRLEQGREQVGGVQSTSEAQTVWAGVGVLVTRPRPGFRADNKPWAVACCKRLRGGLSQD
jgi:hypothetical protein